MCVLLYKYLFVSELPSPQHIYMCVCLGGGGIRGAPTPHTHNNNNSMRFNKR